MSVHSSRGYRRAGLFLHPSPHRPPRPLERFLLRTWLFEDSQVPCYDPLTPHAALPTVTLDPHVFHVRTTVCYEKVFHRRCSGVLFRRAVRPGRTELESVHLSVGRRERRRHRSPGAARDLCRRYSRRPLTGPPTPTGHTCTVRRHGKGHPPLHPAKVKRRWCVPRRHL